MRRAILFSCLIWIALAPPVRADERIRQAQEELRKRNLYFGNVDGQVSAELAGALKRYQARKGFAVTGTVDQETASSLHIQMTAVASAETLPDLPVLRSDSASALPESQRLALEKQAEQNLDLTLAPPAESPGPGQNLTPEQVTQFVRDYLRDAETDDVAAQVKYFAFPVEYFPHGSQDQRFVIKDVRDYVNRWPERKYVLTTPVSFFAAEREGETNIEFTISFALRSPARTSKNKASGHTKNWWTIRPEGENLKIVAIREQRLRE